MSEEREAHPHAAHCPHPIKEREKDTEEVNGVEYTLTICGACDTVLARFPSRKQPKKEEEE